MWEEFGKLLITAGIICIVVGAIFLLLPKLPLGNIPFGRLPGDITYERPGLKIYFPWVSCLILSIVLSLIFYLFRK